MSIKLLLACAASSVLSSALIPAVALADEDAQVGKVYEVTVDTEVTNPFVGQYGDVRIGNIAVQIPNAKKGQKYSVTIKGIADNPFTGLKQAACSFKQVGDERTGECNKPPG